MSIINRMLRVGNINWNRLSWVIAIETALLMVAASLILPGGDDFYRFYLSFASGCLHCGFVPYFAQWVLWPLKFFPAGFAWTVWTAISLTGWLGLCWYTKANPALVLLAFPAFGQIWLGQIDIFVGAGLALALSGNNAYARGAGIALALIKPQISVLPILVLLSRERDLAKVLAVPLTTVVASLVVFGVSWPLEWMTYAANQVPLHAWRLAAKDFWPIGLLFIWLPLLFDERRQRFESAVLLATVSTPFVGVYSYLIFLVFVRKVWWSVPLSYAWLLAYPLWHEASMRLAWVLPVVLLLDMVYTKLYNRAT